MWASTPGSGLLYEEQTRRASRLRPRIMREPGKHMYRPGGMHAARRVGRGLWEGPRGAVRLACMGFLQKEVGEGGREPLGCTGWV